MRQIAAFGQIPTWLWENPNGSHTFEESEQDDLIASAISLANDNRPVSASLGTEKSIVGISFFYDLFPCTNCSVSFIGANIRYAACSGSAAH